MHNVSERKGGWSKMRKALIVSIAVVAVFLMGSLAMATTFTDVSTSSVYATAVNVISNDNIMSGVNGLFQGTSTVDRYQLAQTAFNLLNYLEQDPSIAKASDLEALQSTVGELQQKLNSTDSIVVTLENQVGILTVVSEQLKKATAAASATAEKALIMANINNNMIANMNREIAGLTGQVNDLQSSLSSFKTEVASTTQRLTQMINDNAMFLYKKIDLVNQQVTKNTTAIASLTTALNNLSAQEANDIQVLTTQLNTTSNYLENQISFVKSDLVNTRNQLTNDISNTKTALESQINTVNNRATTAAWIGVAGIAVGTFALGIFLYWVWYLFPQY
jgi:chromosome segregation ATPase